MEVWSATLTRPLRPRSAERVRHRGVAPLRILDGHLYHERDDLPAHRGPTSTSAGAPIVLRSDQSPVPAENRVRGHDTSHLDQGPSSEFLASHREWTTLGIGQPKPDLATEVVGRLMAPYGMCSVSK